MVGRDPTPTEVGRNPALIKVAQDELGSLDVLVCGNCWSTFYFVEEFRSHKEKPCKRDATNKDRDNKDTRPKIWAFLLWKAKKLANKNIANNAPNSWALYQNWVKLDDCIRETWIVAGKTIQSFVTGSKGELSEMPVKITKTVINSNEQLSKNIGKSLNINKSANDSSENGPMTVKGSQIGVTAGKVMVNKAAALNVSVSGRPANKQNFPTPSSTLLSQGKPVLRRAKRTPASNEDSTELTDENVEKIVAKRYNPRRKMHEFFVKWEGRIHDQSTWEPAVNLEKVPHLLDMFERQLARQKETRARQTTPTHKSFTTSMTQKLTDEKTPDKSPILSKSMNENDKSIKANSLNERPARSSKTRAMDQVKQWMSGGSPTRSTSPHSTAEVGGQKIQTSHVSSATGVTTTPTAISAVSQIKRKIDDIDFNNSKNDLPTTTSTMEDLEDDLIPTHTVKRLRNGNATVVEVKTPKVNGVSSELLTTAPTSADVIITNSKDSSGIKRKSCANFETATQHLKKKDGNVRYLTKAESTVSSSGIIKLPSGIDIKLPSGQKPSSVYRITSNPVVNTAARSTIRTASPTIRQLAGGTTIQRKIVTSAGTGGQTVKAGQTRIGNISSSTTIQPTSGGGSVRAALQRNTVQQRNLNNNVLANKSTVTPEQKILQLSKSGDLKVTKKVMTSEDVQQQRQQQMRQQPPSQIQIQKLQSSYATNSGGNSATRNTSTPTTMNIGSGVTATLKVNENYSQSEDESTLCPITGKLLGAAAIAAAAAAAAEAELQQQQEQEQHAADVLQAAQMMEELQQQQPPLQQQQHLNTLAHEAEQQQQQLQQQQLQQHQEQQQLQDIDASLLLAPGEHSMLTNEDGSPLLVTGEDGTVYHVAGKNSAGQTILVTQGLDGEQQFAYVASSNGDENQQGMTIDTAMAEVVGHLPVEQEQQEVHQQQTDELGNTIEGQYLVKTQNPDGTTQVVAMTEAELAQHQVLQQQQQHQQQQQEQHLEELQQQQQQQEHEQAQQVMQATPTSTVSVSSNGGQLCIQTTDADGNETNIPAEVVQAEMPSPGGTRRVVLLLQDGSFMMTEMHDNAFKALNIQS